MNTHFSKLMEHLDEIKDGIPEGKYLQFCNALRDAKQLADRSIMYNIKYVDATVTMNHATVSVVTPRVVQRSINPYEFFCHVQPEFMDMKINKLRETIAAQGFARTTHPGPCDTDDTPLVNIYWDEGNIDVRLDRCRDIIIFSLEPVSGLPKCKPLISMHIDLFRRMAAFLESGRWKINTDDNDVTSICDLDGKPQAVQREDGTIVQMVYPHESPEGL